MIAVALLTNGQKNKIELEVPLTAQHLCSTWTSNFYFPVGVMLINIYHINSADHNDIISIALLGDKRINSKFSVFAENTNAIPNFLKKSINDKYFGNLLVTMTKNGSEIINLSTNLYNEFIQRELCGLPIILYHDTIHNIHRDHNNADDNNGPEPMDVSDSCNSSSDDPETLSASRFYFASLFENSNTNIMKTPPPSNQVQTRQKTKHRINTKLYF